MLAWRAMESTASAFGFAKHIERAATWSLAARGKTAPRSSHVGHDTELVGWSWAADTHSWLEPTCMFVMGLRAAGFNDHPRVREGVRLIVDRLLPDGGANYGNTIVLGQPLVAHVQPTGLALLALGGEGVDDPRIGKSLDYLSSTINPEMAAPSLAMALAGLTAHGRRPAAADEWIIQALAEREASSLAVYEQALLLFAAATSPLTDLAAGQHALVGAV
jgi:hypothetical protein